MTELELYKYVNGNNIEWHWAENNEGVNDVFILPLICQLEEFSKLIKSSLQDEHITCYMRNGYLAIWMKDICERYDIDIINVFCE